MLLAFALLALPNVSFATNNVASRLGLVPIAPGGSAADPPVYSADEISRISFGVFIDPELRGGDAEEYLRERAQLCLAGYGVQLFERDASDQPQASSMLLQEADGTVRLDVDKLTPGTVYGWRVVAALQDGSEVLSTPLYFTVSAAAREGIDGGDELTVVNALELLQRMTLEQQREAAALHAYLTSTLVFETYPTASDSYICAPIGPEGLLPLPAQLRSGQVPPQILPLLGSLMQQAENVQEALRTDEPASDKVDALITQLDQLLQSVSYGRALSARAPTLGATLKRLQAAKNVPEQTVALLSELRLSLDSAIGFGSMNLHQDYKDAFAAYAEMAEERLSNSADWDLLVKLYGADEAGSVLNIVNDQRGALALLRDEVAKGRLSKTQLAKRLRDNHARAGQATYKGYEVIESARCEVVGEPKKADSAKLLREQFHCRLAHLLLSVWPD